MAEWVTGFLVPIIQLVLVLGFFGVGGFYLAKAIHNGWSKKFKFVWKHTIRGKPYPLEPVKWCIRCVEEGIGYYDAKKILMVKAIPRQQINETLWIYNKMIIELQGGVNKNDRKFKRVSGKIERATETKLPDIRDL